MTIKNKFLDQITKNFNLETGLVKMPGSGEEFILDVERIQQLLKHCAYLKATHLEIARISEVIPTTPHVSRRAIKILTGIIQTPSLLESFSFSTQNGISLGQNSMLISNQVILNDRYLPDASNPNIRSLTLENAKIEPSFIEKLLTRNLPNLTELNLKKCTLSNETLIILAAIMNSTSLEKLYLSETHTLHQGQVALLNAAVHNQTLVELYISSDLNEFNRESPEHVETVNALNHFIQYNTTLETLSIRGCGLFRDETRAMLSQTLRQYNRSLIEIYEPRYNDYFFDTLQEHYQLMENESITREKKRFTSLHGLRKYIYPYSFFEYKLTQQILASAQLDNIEYPAPENKLC